jgi:hypothetical protein
MHVMLRLKCQIFSSVSPRRTCHLSYACVIFDRPVSSYAMFFRDTQAVIKGHNPAATFGDISKIVAAMWDNLDDKTKAVS